MTRRISIAALVAVLAFAVAWAGEPGKMGAAAPNAKMEEMKAMFAKCAVCKNMLTNFDELMPVMKSEFVKMDNGMAIIHRVSDPKKVAMFHADCQAMHKAGESCMTMTDEQAKTDLCPFCQEIRGLTKAGAIMSMGETKSGSIMVLTSSDPALQARISSFQAKCAMEMAGPEKPAPATKS